MKRTLHSVIFLTSMLLLLFCLSGCSALEEMTEEPKETQSKPNIVYGKEYPRDCSITDCILLGPDTQPKENELLGTGGASGLLSEFALAKDGQDLQRAIHEETYTDERPCYLVCLFYGDFPSTDLLLETYLKFTLVTETGVLHDDNCVELLGDEYLTGVYADMSVNMNNPPDARLIISPGQDDRLSYGMVVIPFRPLYDGILYAHLSLEYVGKEHLSKIYIDEPAVAAIGNPPTIDTQVNIDNFSVNYLTEAAYNMGNYSDDDFTTAPSFSDSNICYMVMDFGYTAINDNDGTQSINIMACVPEAEILKATIEEAPTGKIEESVINNITSIYAKYSVPSTANSTKQVRMVVKLTSLSEGIASVDVFLVGVGTVQTTGHTHINTKLVVGTPALRYTLSSDGTYYVVSGLWKSNVPELTIPDTYSGLPVRELAPDFLQNNPFVSTITIGNNITHLPANVFDGCSSLQEIVIGTGIKELPKAFFSDYNTLRIVTLHEGLSRIPDSCFQHCISLVSVNGADAVTEIGASAFSGCRNLATLNCGPLSHIPDNCFQNCSSLVTIGGSDTVTEIGISAFSGCSSLEVLDFGTVTSLGEEAFRGCSSLTTIDTITVSKIPRYAFADCTRLLWFDLTGVTFIGERAFENCKSFDQIIIPDSCKFFDDNAFSGTSGVKHIYIGKELAPEYKHIYPDGLTSTLSLRFDDAFDGTSLESICVSDSSKYWYVSGNCLLRRPQLDDDGNIVNVLILGCSNSIIPNEVTHITPYAFQNCVGLTHISLPDTVKKLGGCAFMGCTNLQTVDLSDNLEYIGGSAFADCSSLQSITIPTGVKFIGITAFRGCTSLTDVIMRTSWYVTKSSYAPAKYLHVYSTADAAEWLTDTYCDYMFALEKYYFPY